MAEGLDIKVPYKVYAAVRDALAEQHGKKLDTSARNLPITIAPDDKLIDPIDWRLSNVRKDAANFTAQVFQFADGEGNAKEFVEFASAISDFIINGKQVVETEKKGWS